MFNIYICDLSNEFQLAFYKISLLKVSPVVVVSLYFIVRIHPKSWLHYAYQLCLDFYLCCYSRSGHSLMGTQPSHILISSQFYQQAPSSTHRLTLQPYSSNQPHPHPLNNDLLIITSGGRKSATPGAVVSICNMAILEIYELKISSNHFRPNARVVYEFSFM